VKIAKGLRLGYYRGSAAGTWIGRRYRGGGCYDTVALGLADDLTDADGSKVFDFWNAQGVARQCAEKQRLIDEGMVRGGPYTVADAVHEYLVSVRAEKGPAAERGAKYIFNASILLELGPLLVEKLTADRLLRWRNSLATRPKRLRTKRTAERPATRETLTEEGALCFTKWTRGRDPNEHVFLRHDDRVWGPSHQQRPLEQAGNVAGLAPPVTFHVLRHTHASQLAMRGVPMAVIAKQLGHADTRMTEKHYAHLAPNYVAETIRASFPVLGITEMPALVPLPDTITSAVMPVHRASGKS
jgi:hypothetical protein